MAPNTCAGGFTPAPHDRRHCPPARLARDTRPDVPQPLEAVPGRKRCRRTGEQAPPDFFLLRAISRSAGASRRQFSARRTARTNIPKIAQRCERLFRCRYNERLRVTPGRGFADRKDRVLQREVVNAGVGRLAQPLGLAGCSGQPDPVFPVSSCRSVVTIRRRTGLWPGTASSATSAAAITSLPSGQIEPQFV